MARLRYNGLVATLGADLAAGDTTIAFAAALTHAGGAVPTIGGGDTIALSLLDAGGAVTEIVSLTAYASGATTGTIARAQEGTTAVTHAASVQVVHSATVADFAAAAGQGLKDFDRKKRTSGDVTINSTTFVDVDSALDLVLTAAAGDVIECRLAANGEKSTSGSTWLVFDFHTIVGGSPVNSVTSESAAGTGLTGSFPAFARGTVGAGGAFPGTALYSGSKRYTLQAGDISAGTVTLRLRAFSGASCIVRANDPMLYVEATNLGPQL